MSGDRGFLEAFQRHLVNESNHLGELESIMAADCFHQEGPKKHQDLSKDIDT